MEKTLELTPPEAAVALAVLVSFSDDDPSEAEGVVLRKYYRYSTAASLQEKLSGAGYTYPHDLRGAEETIVRTIASAPEPFRLRSLAVAWLLALADGIVNQDELRLLSTYADALGVALAEARDVAESGLPEIDERTTDEIEIGVPGGGGMRESEASIPDLSPAQAGIALACWVAFADDEPTDAEAAVVRDFYTSDEVESTIAVMNDAGHAYPDGLPNMAGAISRTLSRQSRDEQLRLLAIARRTASADGTVESTEEDVLRRYCEEFGIGMAEIGTFFNSSAV